VVAFANGMAGSRTVEDFCSRTGVVRSLTALAGLHPDSIFHRAMARHVEDGKSGPLGSGAIAECYEAGDPLVCDVVHAAADLLGSTVANWVTMMSMRTVVLGGGLTEAIGKPWVERVEAAARARVFPQAIAPRIAVRMTKLRGDARLERLMSMGADGADQAAVTCGRQPTWPRGTRASALPGRSRPA
jgi:predicted NBD/HSP70 family sugar kinase